MLTDAIPAYFYFVSIFTLLWFLAKEWTLLKAGPGYLHVQHLANARFGFAIFD